MAKTVALKKSTSQSKAGKSPAKPVKTVSRLINKVSASQFEEPSFGTVKKIKVIEKPEELHQAYADQPIECFFEDMSERLMRIQRDLIMPAFVFERAKIQNTITFFGSAQIKPEQEARANLEELEKKLSKTAKKTPDMKVRLENARMALDMSKYYTAAEDLANRLQEWSNCLNVAQEDKFYIMTGGGPGIMEAANKGAFRAGGKTAGLTIFIPDEQRRNDYVAKDAWVNFNYFLMRKFWLLFFAKALVVFPGGTGTFDEFFEVFTLMKTRKTHNYIPTVLFGSAFWNKVVDFDYWIKTGVINVSDMAFFKIVDTVDEAYEYIVKDLEKMYF